VLHSTKNSSTQHVHEACMKQRPCCNAYQIAQQSLLLSSIRSPNGFSISSIFSGFSDCSTSCFKRHPMKRRNIRHTGVHILDPCPPGGLLCVFTTQLTSRMHHPYVSLISASVAQGGPGTLAGLRLPFSRSWYKYSPSLRRIVTPMMIPEIGFLV
jgi:hypothetical protein